VTATSQYSSNTAKAGSYFMNNLYPVLSFLKGQGKPDWQPYNLLHLQYDFPAWNSPQDHSLHSQTVPAYVLIHEDNIADIVGIALQRLIPEMRPFPPFPILFSRAVNQEIVDRSCCNTFHFDFGSESEHVSRPSSFNSRFAKAIDS